MVAVASPSDRVTKLKTILGKFFMSNIRPGKRQLTIACRCGGAGPIVFRNLDFRL